MANKQMTPQEWQKLLTQHIADRKKFAERQALAEAYEDLRDDVMSCVKNSGLSYEEIHERCGPCKGTLSRWANKEVKRPQLGKMRSTMRILGGDVGVIAPGDSK